MRKTLSLVMVCFLGLTFLVLSRIQFSGRTTKLPPSKPPSSFTNKIVQETYEYEQDSGKLRSRHSHNRRGPANEIDREEDHDNLAFDEPEEAMEFYRAKRLPEGDKQLPMEKYFDAKAQLDQMPQFSLGLNKVLPSRSELKSQGPSRVAEQSQIEALGSWTSLGPGNVGGRIRSLLINPVNPSIMYAGGVAGGVWKSIDGGGNWTPLGDFLSTLAVSCLSFDPTNPNIIYAGTGEGFFNSDALRGAGILKSVDAGGSWQLLAGTSSSDFYYVNDLVISQANPTHLYAGTRSGVMRSLDGGATWTKVLSYTDGCMDLAIRSDLSVDYLFAACGSFSGGEIFRNVDAGGAGSWDSVLKEAGMGRTSLAIAPSDKTIVYAISASIVSGQFKDGLFAVYRSNSSGDAGTWSATVRNTNSTKLNTVLFTNPSGAFRTECGIGPGSYSNQGWYDNVIAVDPLDSNRVWVGGIDLFRSDDGGQNWGIASYWWANPAIPQYAHADQHLLVFHPKYDGNGNRQLFVGNDGGIFRTLDARAFTATGSTGVCRPDSSAVAWQSLNSGLGVTQFYHGSVFPDGQRYFGGTQDNGTVLGDSALTTNAWQRIFGGDGGYGAVDPGNPSTLFTSTPRGNFLKSTDGGTTFASVQLGLNESQWLFIPPLQMDPSNPQILWTGGNLIWRSLNGGADWTNITSDTSGGSISAVNVSPSDSSKVAAGRSSGNITILANALGSPSYTYSLPRIGYVSWLAFDPSNSNRIFATYSSFGGKHVFRSDNGGASWNYIDGNLPDIPVHCIWVDPDVSTRIIIGTDLGVMSTADGGLSWNVENTGFANVPVESLAVISKGGVRTLFAFTHGRGVWKVALGNSGCEVTLGKKSASFDAFGGNGTVAASTSCTLQATSNVPWIGITQANNGIVSYVVAPNSTLNPLAGTLTINGVSFAVFQSARIDKTPPVIKITSPTSAPTYNASGADLQLAGTLTEDSAISTFFWFSNRGDSGNVTWTGSTWSAFIPVLYPGPNELLLKATDSSGNVGSSKLTVYLFSNQIIDAFAGNGTFGFSGDDGPAGAAAMAAYDVAADNQGNVYFSEIVNNRIRKVSNTGTITTVAGTGTRGSTGDGGPAKNAQIGQPWGIGLDSLGNVYFAEADTASIRKIDISSGIISTVATKAQGGWLSPRDVAVDSSFNLYVADFGLHHIVKFTAGGTASIFAGSNGGYGGDGGPATSANLNAPISVAVDSNGNVVFADSGNFAVRRVTTDGKIATVGQGKPLQGVATDPQGVIYYTLPRQMNRVRVDGSVETVIPDRSSNRAPGDGGPPFAACLTDAAGVSISANGVVYVVSDNRIRKIANQSSSDTIPPAIVLTTPTSGADFTTANKTVSVGGKATDNQAVSAVTWENDRGGNGSATGTNPFSFSVALQLGLNRITIKAWDANGNFSSSTLNVNCTPPSTLNIVAGSHSSLPVVDGIPAIASAVSMPEAVAIDTAGNLIIADTGNHRIRRVTRTGLITTIAGTGQVGSSGDGGPGTSATLNQPSGLAVDSSGSIYIADTNNHRIRRLSNTGILTTVAGTGANAFAGDNGPASLASLSYPVGLAIDSNGDLLIADAGNNRIRKLANSTGLITTVAGSAYGSGGDGGQALLASFYFPTGVAVDSGGSIYVADTGNNAVRKISSNGVISKFAGTGTAGNTGNGGLATSARLAAPGQICFDSQGNLYITDQVYSVIRVVNTSGIITTFAGSGSSSFINDDGALPTSANLSAPAGITSDSAGNIFIADTGGNRVVAVAAFRSATTVSGASYSSNQTLAVESVASVFGSNLATQEMPAPSLPLPTEMAGTSVRVRDSLGVERLAPLFYVGKFQINFQVPAGTAVGFATAIITNSLGQVWSSAFNVVAVQPGVFSATSDGNGLAAASLVFIKNGLRSNGQVSSCGSQGCVANPIDLGAFDEVFLELYGTGIRFNSGLSNVTVTVGGLSVPVQYAGPHCCFFAVDQINVPLPKTLAGAGQVQVVVTVDGKEANRVSLSIK